MDEEIYWLGFSCCPGIGPTKMQKLLDFFGTAENVWNAERSSLLSAKIGVAAVENIIQFRKTFSPFTYAQELKRKKVHFITRHGHYPKLLAQIARPPAVLYIMGNVSLLQDEKLFAVVGTRKITEYGRRVTEVLTEDLVDAGWTIVSGLAMGVDAVAHKVTVQKQGRTIAVLGSGVDICTPQENFDLYQKILQSGGAIVSEVPLGTLPNKGSFPSRNRIIAGLSQGVLVTEGAADSGSLITAHDALANHRNVFAVPGPITSGVSRGPNALISQGATMVMSAEDIFRVLGGNVKVLQQTKLPQGDSPAEKRILEVLIHEQLYFDDIAKKTTISPVSLGIQLSLMEMKGYIVRLESGHFMIKQ